MAKAGFHDVSFPAAITAGARGGPRLSTSVTSLASGAEIRQARWVSALRQWDVAGGVVSLADAEVLLTFFEARQGRRYGFRFRDPLDHSSAIGGAAPSATDQTLGTGDGATTVFPLVKSYGDEPYTVSRVISLVESGSLTAAVDGTELSPAEVTLSADCDAAVLVTAPPVGAVVTAGFLFDVPARFDVDALELELGARGASVPSVPIREVRL